MNMHLVPLLAIVPMTTFSGSPADPRADAPTPAIVHEARLVTDDLDLQAPITVPRFDPSIGSLERVEVEVVLELDGLVALENTSDRLAFTRLDVMSRLHALVPGRGPTLTAIDADAEVVLDRFDGVRDFDGSSGRVLPVDLGAHATYAVDEGLDAYELGAESADVTVPIALRGALRVNGSPHGALRAAWHAEVVVRVRYVYARA